MVKWVKQVYLSDWLSTGQSKDIFNIFCLKTCIESRDNVESVLKFNQLKN